MGHSSTPAVRLQSRKRRGLQTSGFSPVWNVFWHIIIACITLACVLPFIYTMIISITDERSIALNGYQFFPDKLDFSAYTYLFKDSGQLLGSYMVTISVTVLGTLLSLLLILPYGYAISRPEFEFKKLFTFIAFLTMLFNAGIVPFYMVMTQLLHLKDTIWALILPLSVNAFYIIVIRTFYKTTVSEGIVESARIDGAGDFTIFVKIVLPISLPGIATIGLFSALGYWNDWFNAMMFIDDPRLTPLQYLLMRIQNNIQYLLENSELFQSAGTSDMAGNLPQETIRMAMVVVATGPIVLAYPFFQRFFIQGLTVGAIKG